MKQLPENEEAPAGRQGAISDEETHVGCPSALVASIRLARVALTEAEFWEWIDGLHHPIAPEWTGSDDSMSLYREYAARETGQ